MTQRSHSCPSTRRDFLRTASTTMAAAGALAAGFSPERSAHAAGDDTLRIGLVGCGGRGTGAAVNALGADTNCKLVAMADTFNDRLQGSLDAITKHAGDKIDVKPDHCFIGFDAGQKLIECGDVDVVLLCEPPHFRPMHLKAAIDAGKHVFAEKPVAIDAPGVRSVLATAEEAKKKGLNLVVGLCWRYDLAVREAMKRVLDGAIGDIHTIQETYLSCTYGQRPRQPDWTEMEYQLRNWMYFCWLSGDFNVEQHVHSLDKAAWAMHEEPPVRAWGVGGRQVRVDPKYGDIFDHHAVVYEYGNGVQVYAFCRQMAGVYNDVTDIIRGSKGYAVLPNKPQIAGENSWRYKGPRPSMYDVEHQDLFAAIRSGKTINDGLHGARSTMLGILGRMVNHTGQALTWEQAINSQQTLAPAKYAFDVEPPTVPGKDGKYPVSVPGQTKFI